MNKHNNLNVLYKKIERIVAESAGIVTTRQTEEVGIYRGFISRFVEDGFLVKETNFDISL